MRVRIFAYILLSCLLYLIGGLFYTQVIKHDQYKIMSEENRLRVLPLMAPRGAIRDRNGKVLVKDELRFDAAVVYSQVKDAVAIKEVLSGLLDVPKETLSKKLKKARRTPYTPISLVGDIGIEGAINLEEVLTDYPGLLVHVKTKRGYLYGDVASGVLGYLGLINRDEFKRMKHYGYKINDLVGRAGVEKVYDNYLRGIYGGKQIEVNNVGREISTLGYKEPVPGRDVYLTLDLDLQKYCDSLMADHKGAIIAMDPKTGEILALASAPRYDPGIFVDKKRSKEVMELFADKNKDHPFINRAISGAYPLGSVFKLIVAAGALEEGVISEYFPVNCAGKFNLGKAVFRCWKEQGHGEQMLRDAIKNSCNVYFYNIGLMLGVDALAKYSGMAGFGEKTGIELPREKAGILPSREWKRKRMKAQWYKGETVNYSIGQGYLSVTPLQAARMVCIFANDGKLVNPTIIKAIGDVQQGNTEPKNISISSKSINIVREGMKECVNHPRGTGQKAKQEGLIVSGKTGTAQTHKGINHGWFGGFAPYDNPQLVVLVFDEYGGKGGYFSAETAGKVFSEAKKLGIISS
jgi:penicillin-binding protein 2